MNGACRHAICTDIYRMVAFWLSQAFGIIFSAMVGNSYSLNYYRLVGMTPCQYSNVRCTLMLIWRTNYRENSDRDTYKNWKFNLLCPTKIYVKLRITQIRCNQHTIECRSACEKAYLNIHLCLISPIRSCGSGNPSCRFGSHIRSLPGTCFVSIYQSNITIYLNESMVTSTVKYFDKNIWRIQHLLPLSTFLSNPPKPNEVDYSK